MRQQYKDIILTNINIMLNTRQGKKWTTNEIINLQREYELLEMSASEIAVKHKRTTNAITYKLKEEGLWKEELNINGSIEYEQEQRQGQQQEQEQEQEQKQEQEFVVISAPEKTCISDCDMMECVIM